MKKISGGKILSGGVAMGKAFVFVRPQEDSSLFYDISEHQVDNELFILDTSINKLCSELETLQERVEEEIDKDLSLVFKAHQVILADPAIKGEMVAEIEKEFVSAASAAKTVFRRWMRRFSEMESDISSQKQDDLRDLKKRLIRFIGGVEEHPLKNVPEDCILIAKNLAPSDTVYLSSQSVAGVIIEEGGNASHATLFCREISLPCIGQIKDALKNIETDNTVLLNTNSNEIVINPDTKMLEEFEEKIKSDEELRIANQQHAQEKVTTRDGVLITVAANIGNHDDSVNAVVNGADAVGLLRLEKIYMSWQTPPSQEALSAELKSIFSPFGSKEITVRLLDIGSDKRFPYVELPQEANPTLGCRGIRLLKRYTSLLETQLDALIELSHQYNLRVIIPMVTKTSDITLVKVCLQEREKELNKKALFKLGIMIETPAAALSSSSFIPHIDSISFGTNDLTQYTFAADRENSLINEYFDDSSDVIFRLIEIVKQDTINVPLSICGELASQADYVEKLIQSGIRTLSVVPALIPSIKQAVRRASAESSC